MPLSNRAVVLVIDDEDDTRYTLLEMLREEGYDVVGRSSGAEALAYVEGSTRPVVLFLGGLCHVAEFRAHLAPSSRALRAILATGALPERIPELPGVVVLRKPLDAEHALAAVAEAVRQLGGRRDGREGARAGHQLAAESKQ